MKILLVTGAGASVELGIPGMRQMVKDFHAHLRSLRLSEDVFDRFEKMLNETHYDMEQLIEHVESLEKGQKSQSQLGLDTNDSLLRTSRAMRWEAEWYVQYVCERLRSIDAKTMWGATFRQRKNHELCIATTNYDKSVEMACIAWEVPIEDGFEELGNDEVARWEGLKQEQGQGIRLLKIHGSTDWYYGDDRQVYKLRHPMPIYGNLELALADEAQATTCKMTSCLILPTREKRTTLPPYPDLITDFRNFARTAEIAIFVGTSLRDPDLYDVCEQCAARGTPTYVVTDDADLAIPSRAKKMIGKASRFLTSTLPTFLACSDSNYLDNCSDESYRRNVLDSVFDTHVKALDCRNKPDEICLAIDKLVDCGTMLDLFDICTLLSNEDVGVRKHSLALIPRSIDREEAMKRAETIASSGEDQSFGEEFSMLKEMVASLPA